MFIRRRELLPSSDWQKAVGCNVSNMTWKDQTAKQDRHY
jgi:hypothetical protein